MMKNRQLKVGGMLSYFSTILGYMISIVYTPVMLRLLGQTQYGLYNLVYSIVSYLGLLSFGFGSSYIRFYSRYEVKDDRKSIAKLNGMFLSIFVIIGIVSVIAGLVLVKNTGVILGNKFSNKELSTAKIMMIVMVINIGITFPGIIFNSYLSAKERFIFQNLLQILRQVASPLLTLPMLIMGYGSIGMVIITTIVNITVIIINIYWCLKKLKMRFIFRQYDTSLFKEIAIFSSFIFLNMVTDQINWNVDKFIVGRYKGAVAVSIYGIAAQINTYYMSLSTTISNLFIPRVNKLVASDSETSDEVDSLFVKVGRLQFILMGCILLGIFIFGRQFIIIWAGREYTSAYPILLLLATPTIVPLIQNLGIEVQRAKNLHHFRSWVYFLVALINIVVSIILVKQYGAIGTAFATAMALIFGNIIVMNIYYYKIVKLDMIRFWKEIFSVIPAVIIPAIYGYFLMYFSLVNSLKDLVVYGIIYLLIYFCSMWLFGLNRYEKRLVTGLIGK
ncbi:oligosaccharide flippase family protein [Latilactobacillus sakei]|uniref:oligosaccharide flippase family protein n=1 Tax=Latilactobacillus sakei TaxID=1599 RepID=UPI00232B2325|nr:oligosaccharide flippase family protein [Latilactobacillus sakei]MDB1553425.1 oligosaccharide flippase family protein [Latilactobacillus sakei]